MSNGRRNRLGRHFGVALSLVLLLSLLPIGTALADPGFASTAFMTKWQRADKPVNDGSASPARSWLWGPESFNPPNGQTEPYAESPGGQRTVQYFDKARMELNNPTTGYVSNGLLVREMISGKLATGDSAFTQRRPADEIPVAGDPDGNNGPTYASFTKLASLNNDNPVANKTGQAVTDTIDKAGTVGTSADLGSKARYVYFDTNLKHNIPDVFMTFMNQKGNVYVNGQLVKDQPVLGDNPYAPWLDAMGLPITDAYWSKVTVGGQVKDVLIQAFERRALTYTPSNDPTYQVEMGNVGRHYYKWRYDAKYDQVVTPPVTKPTPPPAGATCDSLPASKGGAYPFLKCGPAGMVMVVVAPMQAKENVVLTTTSPNGSKSTASGAAQADGNILFSWYSMPSAQGKWTFNFKGLTSGKEAETYVFLTEPVKTPTIIAFPNPGRLDQDITIVVVGFEPRETVILVAIPPVANPPDDIGLVTGASPGGGVTARLIPRTLFTGDLAKYLVPGDWRLGAMSENGERFVSTTVTLTK